MIKNNEILLQSQAVTERDQEDIVQRLPLVPVPSSFISWRLTDTHPACHM